METKQTAVSVGLLVLYPCPNEPILFWFLFFFIYIFYTQPLYTTLLMFNAFINVTVNGVEVSWCGFLFFFYRLVTSRRCIWI